MIVTTSPNIEGKQIIEYKKIVFGEVITGVNFMKDIGAGLRNFFGGRSQGKAMKMNLLMLARKQFAKWNNVRKILAQMPLSVLTLIMKCLELITECLWSLHLVQLLSSKRKIIE